MHWRVLEASGRVAFDVHRMMSALRFKEEERRKRKKEILSTDTVEAAVASLP